MENPRHLAILIIKTHHSYSYYNEWESVSDYLLDCHQQPKYTCYVYIIENFQTNT